MTKPKTTTKLTLELTRDQHQKLHEANPEIVKAPEPERPKVTRFALRDMDGDIFEVKGYEQDTGRLYVFASHAGVFLTPTEARKAARALIVAAGELEGREPVAFPRELCPDTEWNESYTLHHLDTLLKITS